MPQEAQNLYFHLCMNADDDGVVEAFTVMQMLGSSEDNIRILCAKYLVKVLNEDMVSYILDWNEHNLIRADRKINSIYKDLLLQIVPDVEIKDPKPRADTGVIPRQITGRPVDGIGKVRLGKVNTSEQSSQEQDLSVEEIDDEGNVLVKRKGIKKKVTVRQDVFDMEMALIELKRSVLRTKRVVYVYWHYRGWKFANWGQFEEALARELKPAKALVNYEGHEIKRSMDYCQTKWGDDWTLETVSKWIGQANK